MSDLTQYQASFIKRLLSEKRISKTEFAELVGVTPVTVSRWVNGHNEISDYNAKKIKEAFPEYDIAEITGFADAFSAYNIAVGEQIRDRNKLLSDVIVLAFPGEVSSLAIDKDFDPWDESVAKADFKFSHDNKEVTLSATQMKCFEDEICGYIEMRLGQLLERGAW